MKHTFLSLMMMSGIATTAMATIPPLGYSGPDHPELQLASQQEVAHLIAKQQSLINANAYGSGLTADGIAKYGVTCPTGIGSVKTIGSVTLPVLMVEFVDVKFQETSTIEKVDRQFNEPGYSDVDLQIGSTKYAANGSVRDFFHDMSFGLFDPKFEVVGCIKLPKTQAAYFRDEGNTRDKYTLTFVNEAITAATEQGIDFSKYSIAGNRTMYGTTNAVPLVVFSCAGYSEAEVGYNMGQNGQSEGYDMPWPHYSRMSNSEGTDFGRTIAGTKFMSFFIGCELHGSLAYSSNGSELVIKDTSFAGPSTFIHEFGHAIGLPDFYCTNGSGVEGTPCLWSMMDSAPYYNYGYNPVGYTAYERNLLGWLPLTTELKTDPAQCTLYPFSAYGKEGTPEDAVFAYVIRNPMSTKEYYILENRRADGKWYPTRLGNGMLVQHVYFDYNSWEKNTLNNTASTLRYTILPADGRWQHDVSGNNYKNDLFPGVSNNYKHLTNESSPQAATCYVGTKKVMNRPIYNITKVGELITFDFMQDYKAEGIDNAVEENTISTQPAYDLQGRRVSNLGGVRGIVIQGGKHILK